MTKLERASQAKTEMLKIAESLTIPALVDACKIVLYNPKFVVSYGCTNHHCYEGGLACHTEEVTKYALEMTKMFPHANRDVVATAAIFHDYMKIKDYAGSGPGGLVKAPYRYLVRHVAGSHAEFMKAVENAKVSEDIVIKIEHAMLAHHGRLEWESPVTPVLIEAYILHYADTFSQKFGETSKG